MGRGQWAKGPEGVRRTGTDGEAGSAAGQRQGGVAGRVPGRQAWTSRVVGTERVEPGRRPGEGRRRTGTGTLAECPTGKLGRAKE